MTPQDRERAAIREAGGILHSDGNIFFTNVEQFKAAAAALASSPSPGMPEGLSYQEIHDWWASENGLEDCDMAKIVDFLEVVRAVEKKLAASHSGSAPIPEGWVFNTADFSIRAMDGRSDGGVMLKRDAKGTAEWHALPEEERERTDLYVSGVGQNLNEAIADAAARVAAIKEGNTNV